MVDVIDKMFGSNESGNSNDGKDEQYGDTVSFNQMSNNVVEIMNRIATNKGIRKLLFIEDDEPFDDTNSYTPSKDMILNPKSNECRIKPVSFNTEATSKDRVEIRVYYNIGRVDSSGKNIDANIHIDIICAKDLWLIRDPLGRSKIRPYEIMSRIADEIGAKNVNNRNKHIKSADRLANLGNISQFQMLSVNEQFDAIRMYYNIRDISGNINDLGSM